MMKAIRIKKGIPRLLALVEMNRAVKEQIVWSAVICSVIAEELNSKSVS